MQIAEIHLQTYDADGEMIGKYILQNFEVIAYLGSDPNDVNILIRGGQKEVDDLTDGVVERVNEDYRVYYDIYDHVDGGCYENKPFCE